MSGSLLRLDDVGKTYMTAAGEVVALRALSLSVAEGEFVTVTGPSGSGKSTFLFIAGCLDTASSGAVLLDGMDVRSLEDDERSQLRGSEIGFVFQQFNLLPRMSVLDNVALPLIYRGVGRRTRRERAAAVLDRVGLAQYGARLPAQLSSGQQQRVAIARALVNEPRLLLADEPTGALDTHTGAELMEVFVTLNRRGTTIVLVTHEAAVAQAGNRSVRFRDGCLVTDAEAFGSP